MPTENVPILRVSTGEAVKSVGDLRENIKLLKKELEGYDEMIDGQLVHVQALEIGTQEYQDTLEELKINQNALKDAMYATTASLEDITAAATGSNIAFDKHNGLINKETISYNELVHSMANLKEAWRATTDEAERTDLGERINAINDRLKELDKTVGNNSRNVGNYEASFKKALESFPSFAAPAKQALDDINKTSSLLSSNPLLGTVSLLVPVIQSIVSGLKDNQTALDAVHKLMEALKPVTDFFSKVLQTIADVVADLIGKAAEFIGSDGLLDRIIKGVMGVGNAIVQFIITPAKGIIDAVRIIKDEGIKGIGDAAKAIWTDVKSGTAFKSNFEAGKTMADNIMSGAKSRKKEVKQTAKELAETFNEEWDKTISDASGIKAIEDKLKAIDELRKRRQQEQADQIDEIAAIAEARLKEKEEAFAYEDALSDYTKEKEEEKKQARLDAAFAVVDAASSIMSTIADLYESEADASEKSARRVKAIRIASATIDTISGAIGAFMQASKAYEPPLGQIIGASAAATVTASGVAQIAKMRSSNSGGSVPSTASFSAPTIQQQPMQQVRNITSASEEDRLNQMAGEQRVYVVYSDIEAAGKTVDVQRSESTF